MTILAKLLGRGGKGEIPRDIAKLLEQDDPQKVLDGIDRLLTENQVRLERVRRDAFELEGKRSAEIAKVESGDLSDRMESMILDQIGDYEKRLDGLEGRMGILTRNVQTLTVLEGKIHEMLEMQLKGFSEERIEEILLDHGEKKEAYMQAVASTDLEAEYDPIKAEQDEKRAELKARIMKQKEARDAAREVARETEPPLVSEEPMAPDTEPVDEIPKDEPDVEEPARAEPEEMLE